MLLCGPDFSRYQQLKNNLANDMTKGTDIYPKTIVEMMRILNDYNFPPRLQRVWEGNNEGMAFVQGSGGGHRGSQGKGCSITCWHCSKAGHTKNKCPDLQVEWVYKGIDILNIEECNSVHTLFSTQVGCWKEGCILLQWKMKGLWGILHPSHLYMDTSASYASTPYCHLLDNMKALLDIATAAQPRWARPGTWAISMRCG
jgi:hypothetical protein